MFEDVTIPDGGFRVILADPPWPYKNYSDDWHKKNSSSRWAGKHYSLMSMHDICSMPVQDLVAADSALFLWAIGSMLPQALEVIDAWGYTYKTVAFTWRKLVKDRSKPVTGMGHWTRQSDEFVLLGTKGSPKRIDKSVQQAVSAVRGRHSAKPGIVHDRIVRLLDGPYLELFARRTRPGWTCWGAECP